jgi:EmrB/QacA subfamily drug resistance transporter
LQRRVIVPLIVACALFMQNLDATAIATALPAIAEALHETPLRLHLAITVFMLSLAAFLPVSGWVADKFGARHIFRLAMVIFITASILCGFSTSFAEMLVWRMVQGAGGAMMVPVGRLILVRSVPKSELIGAMVLMGMPAMIGPILGPIVGGFVTTYASWHWIFWMNVPIGVLGLILATIYIDDVRETDVKRFDWVGFFLSSVGLTGTLFGMDAATSRNAPDPFALVILAAGLICGALYVRHAKRVDNPILDLNLMKLQTFRASVTGGSVFRLGVGAVPFLLPLLMQEGFGYSPFDSGLVTFFSAAGSLGMRSLARRVLRQFGFRSVLMWNALIASFFIVLCACLNPSMPQALMMAIIFCGGVFRSLEFTALNTIAFAEVDNPQMSQATSFSQMAQRLSLSTGVAISAFILHHASGNAPHIPLSAFAWAFAIVGLLSATSCVTFIGLAEDAGAELAGRQPIRSRRFTK